MEFKRKWYILGLILLLIIIFVLVFLFNNKDTEKDTAQTGYPSGEIQRQYVMVNGRCYIGIGGNTDTLPDEYVYYGTTVKEQNTELPKTDLEGVHVPVGTEVYFDPDDTGKVYCKISPGYSCFVLESE